MAEQDIQQEQVEYSKLWWVTLLAGIIAAGVNVALYFLAQSIGFVDTLVPSFLDAANAPPFTIAIVGVSIIFIAIGGVILWLIDLISEKPLTLWRNIAILALLLSLVQPLFAFTEVNDIALLIVLHIVAGVIAISMIPTMAKKTV